MKMMTIVGTRPEIIRLSRLIALADATEGLDHVLVHTGQNHDYTLNQVFFDDLGVRAPDHYLGVDTSTLGTVLGGVLIETEKVLESERPDAVLVLGDTNSAVSVLMAKRMGIPTFHMEAGNRSFDERVPEETNRRMVDHLADYNLVYTEHARRNLLTEGIHPSRILLTGSPMKEVLDHYRPQIDASDVVERLGLTSGGYFLVSAHRAENVDEPARLRQLLDCLVAVEQEYRLPLIVSTHPRTRNRLESLGADLSAHDIRWMEPFGFHDYNKLQLSARCVLSDSGTISEESAILGFPAVTVRDFIERPEAVDTGSILATGLSPESVLRSVGFVLSNPSAATVPFEYEIGDTARRVLARLIASHESGS